jgi:hypothetical protein
MTIAEMQAIGAKKSVVVRGVDFDRLKEVIR